eukprot:TRINITY_DN66866_c6_g3_i1.p1 TRINITY_DN66866_c6_g3~~TRINITY_DN66866_c6_g3_i1.p1  ORF type:complete len:700 (+),score=96.46 TRINITY_DN66866_c6_g3_i1:26-2125(+)
MLLILAVLLLGVGQAEGNSPNEECYINLSNGVEACYYYPTTGYDCEYCNSFPSDCSNVDPWRRNLTHCGQPGQCYVPLAKNLEVCYYTPPHGFSCYYEYEYNAVANLTLCDNLKANSGPEVTFQLVNPSTTEDTPLSIPWVLIVDLDADDSISEGKGFLQVTLQITNGELAFDYTQAPTLAEQNAAQFVLDPSNDKSAGGLEWVQGNGTWASTLEFIARQTPTQDVMLALMFRPAYNFNSNSGTSVLTVTVNDRGNTGGVAEETTDSIGISATAVNDPPTISIGAQSPSNEDTYRPITTLQIADVDIGEGGSGIIELELTVTDGTLELTTPMGVPTCTGSNSPCSTKVFSNGNRVLTLSSTINDINNVLSTGDLRYLPDLHFFGTEVLQIQADDNGNFGGGGNGITNLNVNLDITAVNDAPTVIVPEALEAVEDTDLTGLNVTVRDVDSTTGLTVSLSVGSGTLSITSPAADTAPPFPLVVSGVTLAQIETMFASATYRGTLNFNGVDTLVIDVTDGTNPAATVNLPILVQAYNDPPTVSFGGAGCGGNCDGDGTFNTNLEVDVGNTLTFDGSGNGIAGTGANGFGPTISVDDIDAGDAPNPEIQVLIVAVHGQVAITTVSNLVFTVPENYEFGPGAATDVFYFRGEIADLNAALDTLVYTRSEANPDSRLIIAVNDMQKFGDGDPETDFQSIPVVDVV